MQIRAAQIEDAKSIHGMICELAEFEKMSDEVESTEESIRAALKDGAHTEAIVAELDGQCIAFALFFHNFSTFVGRGGLYLEDLYVKPEFRRQGVGQKMLTRLAEIAKERNCGRFEWSVLDWNQNAIDFYEKLGATVLSEWRIVRLDEAGIQNLVATA